MEILFSKKINFIKLVRCWRVLLGMSDIKDLTNTEEKKKDLN